MARHLSIGFRWTLRYSLAMALTLGVFAWVVESEVARRIHREAQLLTEIQAHGLVDSLRTQTEEHSPEEVREWLRLRIEREVATADPKLGLGVEYLDSDGASLIAAGSLAHQPLPVPHDLLRGETRSRTRAVNLGGEHAHVVTIQAAPGGFLRVSTDGRRYAENVDHIRDVLAMAIPLVLVLTGLMGWWLARASLSPIARITQTARRITGANLREQIPIDGSGDELDQLGETLNQMIQRIGESVERIHRFNANAAHELSTPLNAIRNQLGVTLDRPRDPDEYRRVLEDVSGQVEHLSQAVEGMLRLSRSEAGLDPARVTRLDLAALLETVVEFFAPVALDREVALRFEIEPGIHVEGDPTWLQQLFSNLLDNAIKYADTGDQIRLHGRRSGDWAVVSVTDTGPGIARSELAGIFDRFQRGDRDRNRPGLGLGLALVREMAHAHGGRVEVESEEGKGATFSVYLPAASAVAPA